MFPFSRTSIVVATLALSTGSTNSGLRAQTITQGPEISGLQGDQIKIIVTFSAPAPAQIRYWSGSEAREAHSTNISSSLQTHMFLLPNQPLQNYVIVVNPGSAEQKSADFTTGPYGTLLNELAKARIHSYQVSNGNVLSFEVDAVNATHVDISWDEDGTTKSESRSLANGNNKFGSITLPAPRPQENNARVVAVTFIARSGSRELHKVTANIGTSRPPIVPPAPVFGNLDVKPASRSVTLTTAFQNVSEDVVYDLTLTQNQFTRTISGPCNKDNCQITVNGLSPSTPYNYTLKARVAPNGASAEFFQQGRQNTFTTDSLPKITNGPRIEFTQQGVEMVVTTNKKTVSQLSYRAQGRSEAVVRDSSIAQTEHRYPIAEALKFTRDANGKLETQLTLVLREPGLPTPLQTLNLTLAGNLNVPSSQEADALKSYGNTRLKNLASKYGPVLMGLLGLPVP